MKTLIKMQFDPQIAKDIGVEEAIMYSNIEFWVAKNEANERNNHDGNYWTYNSISAFRSLFNFWSEKQIKRILRNLEDNQYIKTGNYNKVKYDRTKWYTTLNPNGQMEETEWANGKDHTVKPIPNNKPNNKPNKDNFSEEEKLPIVSELEYTEPEKETFKTKKKIFEQKGLNYTPPKRTTAQELAWDTELLARNLKDETMRLHGVVLYINKTKSGTHWKSLKEAVTKFGLQNCKNMVEYYLNSKKYNEHGSEPNKVFSNDSINIYNKNNKSNKKQNAIGKPHF